MRTGKVKESILKRSVLGQLAQTGQAQGSFLKREESGLIQIGEACGPSKIGKSDGFKQTGVCRGGFPEDWWKIQINPVEGWTLAAQRAVYGAVNALAASCCQARVLAMTLLMPPETEEGQLKKLMKDLDLVCRDLGIRLAAGHTAVTPAVNQLLLSVTGLGTPFPLDGNEPCGGRKGNRDRCEDADDPPKWEMIMTGHAGGEGAAILASLGESLLRDRYAQSFIDDSKRLYDHACQLEAARLLWQLGAWKMKAVREGGVFGGLWELAASLNAGLDVDLEKIPIRQHTIEISEFFDVNPYRLLSGGCLLAVCPREAESVARLEDKGISARSIGVLTQGKDRLVRYDTVTRYLEPSGTDQIYLVSRLNHH